MCFLHYLRYGCVAVPFTFAMTSHCCHFTRLVLNFSRAQLAFVCTKLTSPLRSITTLTLTPPIARAIEKYRGKSAPPSGPQDKN